MPDPDAMQFAYKRKERKAWQQQRYAASAKRTCRARGKDPWPNKFFCRSCHSSVSAYVHQE